MTERLWTADLTSDQLERWLTPPRTESPFTILESLTNIDFPAHNEHFTLANWFQGRIFGESFELRWERQASGYRAWLTGRETGEGFTAMLMQLDETTVEEDQRCYLWVGNEMRIARRMEYRELGSGSGGRPVLVRREFRRQGVLVYYRLVRMEREGTP
ncbi:MAG: hypothetical protein ACREV4_06970 [Gammaproteobacteria bacterium]